MQARPEAGLCPPLAPAQPCRACHRWGAEADAGLRLPGLQSSPRRPHRTFPPLVPGHGPSCSCLPAAASGRRGQLGRGSAEAWARGTGTGEERPPQPQRERPCQEGRAAAAWARTFRHVQAKKLPEKHGSVQPVRRKRISSPGSSCGCGPSVTASLAARTGRGGRKWGPGARQHQIRTDSRARLGPGQSNARK